MAREATDWPREPFDSIVTINNAVALRPDWDYMVYPWDFPAERLPRPGTQQRLIDETDFVPAQNAFGGFVYAGATMVFTAAYWALHALKPRVIAVFGCDMHYPKTGPTHFYGTGSPDPLRADITLRSLEAKSARLQVLAAMTGCAVVNLSTGPSRLISPRTAPALAHRAKPAPFDRTLAEAALGLERDLNYYVPSGRYWEDPTQFDPAHLDQIDQLWLGAARSPHQSLAPNAAADA